MNNSIYGDEAAPIEKILTASGRWEELSKMDIPRWLEGKPVVPVVKSVDFSGEYPSWFADINYDLKPIRLDSRYFENEIKNQPDDFIDALAYSMRGKIEHEIQKLEMAGIPVFRNKNTVPHFDTAPGSNRIIADYQIPKDAMYKAFFVLHDFDTAIKEGMEYAMQQVQKVIDKY